MKPRDLNAGQDSFLDIVANLVGILVILVVLVGAQAQSSWTSQTSDTEQLQAVENLQKKLDSTAWEAKSRQLENHELEQKIDTHSSMVERLRKRRQSMLVQISMAKRELEKRNQDNTESENVRLNAEAKLDHLKYQFASTRKKMNAVQSNEKTKIEKIEHFPAPIAKTVFTNEVHFQLMDGRITFVPMDELIGKMKSEWKVKAEKLLLSSNTYETVGPIGEFRLQYQLASRIVKVATEMGTVDRRVTDFDHFVLRPLSGQTGEMMTKALSTGSDFSNRLDRLKPGRTTVSLWVYPDSYDDLPLLKTRLREKGFQIATWPLQFGKLISGGPNGFRAASQ